MLRSYFLSIAIGLWSSTFLIAQHPSSDLAPTTRAQSRVAATTLLSEVTTAVKTAIDSGNTPGVVVQIGRGDKTMLCQAWGERSIEPRRLPMQKLTRFDCASLTKPVATATSVLKLVEAGRVSLDDPVVKYLPELSSHGKDRITVRQLMQHRAGLIADNPLSDYKDGTKIAWERICALHLKSIPGAKVVYSDVGYIVLGMLVERVDGRTLDRYSTEEIFAPLGMTNTGFLPAPPLYAECAATEKRDGEMLQGRVHDPRAHLLGGVAGHAGLFSTADDLAVWCRMILGKGAVADVRVLKPEVAELFLKEVALEDGSVKRTIALDADPKNAARGDLFSAGKSFGHTGFTGTSLWLDPATKGYVVVLSSRLHPDGKGDAKELRRSVANAAAAAIGR